MSRWARYNTIIIACWAVAFGVLSVLALSMRGDGGELARLGGYRYDDFRVGLELETFADPLYRLARSIEEYDRPYDVVVLGDSFSRNESFGWQNYFVNQTGASVITFDLQRVSSQEIIASRIFQESPPALFLYEIVERSLWLRHSTCSTEPFTQAVRPRSLYVDPLGVKPVSQSPETPPAAGLGAAANVLMKTFLRNVGLNLTRVSSLPLREDDLFSNMRSAELLVYRDDLHKRVLSRADLDTVLCSLSNLRNSVETSGETSFFAIIFPDKLTVYTEILQDSGFADLSKMSEIAHLADERLVALHDVFQDAVAGGVLDVYLPDNTHAGPAGYSLAADFLVARLRELGYLRSRDGVAGQSRAQGQRIASENSRDRSRSVVARGVQQKDCTTATDSATTDLGAVRFDVENGARSGLANARDRRALC